jgi:hypothetical protein
MTCIGKPVVPRETLDVCDIKPGRKFCVLNPESNVDNPDPNKRGFILFGTFIGLGPTEVGKGLVSYEPTDKPGSVALISLIALGMTPLCEEKNIWSGSYTIAW